MATYAYPIPHARGTAQQFLEFLKTQIAPPPGMYSTWARIVITIVITFLIVANFGMPYGGVALYSIFIVNRSSHRAALLGGIQTVIAVTLGIGIALLGVVVFAELPLLTFAYYAFEIFLAAFLIRTTRLQGPALNFSLAIINVHNVWERPHPAAQHLEQTLWVWLTLVLGFAVSVVVELALVREHPVEKLYAELTGRLRAVSKLFYAIASQDSVAVPAKQRVLTYACSGTSSVRQRIVSLRTTDPSIDSELLALNTVNALIARLVDISVTIDVTAIPSKEDALRLTTLATELDRISAALTARSPIALSAYRPPASPSASIPFLPELERSAALIPAAFSAQSPENDPAAQLLDPQQHFSLFLPDAFANSGYLLFALKTTLAALLCYVIYSGLDWPGLNTSVVTVLLTALNTSGATKQKQLLRIAGTVFGGIIALGSLVFLLPEIDSITSVTVLVAAVSAFCAWFALVSPGLSYFGFQTALAFYLSFIQDFGTSAQLAPPRDRALGVLLGVAMMWLVFDNLRPISAADHMQAGLARNLRLLGQMITALDQPDRLAAIQSVRNLRDRIQEGLAAVHIHADSVLFEFGSPNRERHLELRDAVLRLQATLRTLFVVETAICQYRTQIVAGTRPAHIREAQALFDEAYSSKLVEIARAVDELRPAAGAVRLGEALAKFEETARPWVQTLTDQWIKTGASGIMALTHQAVALTESLGEHCFWC